MDQGSGFSSVSDSLLKKKGERMNGDEKIRRRKEKESPGIAERSALRFLQRFQLRASPPIKANELQYHRLRGREEEEEEEEGGERVSTYLRRAIFARSSAASSSLG